MGKIHKAINKSKIVPAANRAGLRGKGNQGAQKNIDKADKNLDAVEKDAKKASCSRLRG